MLPAILRILPTIYAGTHTEARTGHESDDRLRLGRATEWRGEDDEPIAGLGQRTFLIGDGDRPILGLKELVINQPQD